MARWNKNIIRNPVTRPEQYWYSRRFLASNIFQRGPSDAQQILTRFFTQNFSVQACPARIFLSGTFLMVRFYWCLTFQGWKCLSFPPVIRRSLVRDYFFVLHSVAIDHSVACNAITSMWIEVWKSVNTKHIIFYVGINKSETNRWLRRCPSSISSASAPYLFSIICIPT